MFERALPLLTQRSVPVHMDFILAAQKHTSSVPPWVIAGLDAISTVRRYEDSRVPPWLRAGLDAVNAVRAHESTAAKLLRRDVAARDETIRSQNRKIAELEAQLAAARQEPQPAEGLPPTSS